MAATDALDSAESKAPAGVVLPPKGIREILEKTAGYVARNGTNFEDRIRAREATSAKMSFLNDGDAYNPYYRWRVDEIKAGRGNAISAGRENEAQVQQEKKGPAPPPEFHFSARMPNINAQDLEVVKLTALFVAKNGRSWMTQLSQREAGNYQFDFLRPQHSLNQFFTRLTEQYQELINGDTVDNGRPQKRRMQELEHNVQDRFHVLERAKKRAEWIKYQESQKIAKEEQDEKEKIAYQQVDWHDFVVVETVLFTEADENAELPPPTTMNDLQSMSLEQKAMTTLDPNRRIEEAMPTADDYDQFYGTTPTPQPQAFQMSAPPTSSTPQPPPSASAYVPPQDSSDAAIAARTADRERAQQAQAAAKSAAPMRIRSDYVPRAQAKRQAQPANTSLCPNCKQFIANDEIQDHMRIELLDPQWRQQSSIAAQRSSTTNLSTQDVANNLKRLASQRSDVFDPVTGAAISAEEEARRKRAEMGSYDGVSSSAMSNMANMGPPGAGPPGAPGAGEGQTDVQEQIRLLHQRYRTG